MRKGQINSEILKYVLISVVSLMVIVFSVMVINNLRNKQREVTLEGFKGDIGASVEVIATRTHSVEKGTYSVPENVDLVCFLDLDRSDEILESDLVDYYPFIGDSLESGSEQNVFMISNDVLDDAFYEEDICFENEPYYQCIGALGGSIDIYLEGLGSCATIFTNYSMYVSSNIRKDEKYTAIEFGGIMAKEDDPKDVLQLLPIAFVNNKNGTYREYPFFVYYDSGNSDIEDLSIGDITSESLDTLILFDESSCATLDLGVTLICDYSSNNLEYWSTIYDITLISQDNNNGALIAALFAAFTNTPLIFVDGSMSLDTFTDLENINIVDVNDFDQDFIDGLEDNINYDVRYFSSSGLRILSHNRILNLDSEVNIIDT